MPAKKSFFSRMKADMAARSMSRPISRPAAFKAPLMISTVMGSTGMVTPFCAALLLLFLADVLALVPTAETVPNRVHLCQAGLVEASAAPCQFMFDTLEAALEFGYGLT